MCEKSNNARSSLLMPFSFGPVTKGLTTGELGRPFPHGQTRQGWQALGREHRSATRGSDRRKESHQIVFTNRPIPAREAGVEASTSWSLMLAPSRGGWRRRGP